MQYVIMYNMLHDLVCFCFYLYLFVVRINGTPGKYDKCILKNYFALFILLIFLI